MTRWEALPRNHRKAVPIGQRKRFFFIDDNGFARLNGQDPTAGAYHGFDGRDTNRGHVETHVLLRLGHLDQAETAGGA